MTCPNPTLLPTKRELLFPNLEIGENPTCTTKTERGEPVVLYSKIKMAGPKRKENQSKTRKKREPNPTRGSFILFDTLYFL